MRSSVGLDFDNTIISYDDVIYRLARSYGFIQETVKKSKKDVRDAIRQTPDGEMAWQRLQGLIYGPAIDKARLIKGVRCFLKLCKHHGIEVCIISHKTEYARGSGGKTNLRRAALGWMEGHRFFEPDGLGFSPNDVFFEATRHDKIERIKTQKCEHFIDDLPEVLTDPTFPTSVEKILYDPHGTSTAESGMTAFTSWEDISHHFFSSAPRL